MTKTENPVLKSYEVVFNPAMIKTSNGKHIYQTISDFYGKENVFCAGDLDYEFKLNGCELVKAIDKIHNDSKVKVYSVGDLESGVDSETIAVCSTKGFRAFPFSKGNDASSIQHNEKIFSEIYAEIRLQLKLQGK